MHWEIKKGFVFYVYPKSKEDKLLSEDKDWGFHGLDVSPVCTEGFEYFADGSEAYSLDKGCLVFSGDDIEPEVVEGWEVQKCDLPSGWEYIDEGGTGYRIHCLEESDSSGSAAIFAVKTY